MVYTYNSYYNRICFCFFVEGEIVMSEKIRRAVRLKPHYENSVWEARAEPPPEWNAPLPDWMEERNKGSFLAIKAQEMKEGKNSDELRSYCVIS